MEKFSLNNFEENILNMDKAGGVTAVSNIGGLVTLNEQIEYNCFCDNFRILVAENVALRKNVDSNGKIYITEDMDFPIEHIYFENENDVQEWADKQIQKPFSVDDKWLFEIYYITVGAENYLLLKVHHIICDGMGMVNICRKFQEILKRTDKTVRIVNSTPENTISKEKYARAVKFFDDYIKNEKECCLKENSLNYKAKVKNVIFNKEIYDKIKMFAEKNSVSAGIIIMGSIYKYFSEIMNREKIIIGSVFLNRNNKNINDISMAANTMPVVMESVENSFGKTCNGIGKTIFRLMKYGFYSQNDLYENQGIHSNLFDISISYRNEKLIPALEIGSIRELFTGYCDSNIRFFINEKENSIELEIRYKTDLYSDEYASLLLDRMFYITQQGINDVAMDKISIFTEKDIAIYKKMNNTYYDYGKSSIQECFCKVVEEHSKEIALTDVDNSLTFDEFNKISNSVIHFLKDKKVEKGSTIGVKVKRSVYLPVILMGILKSGCVYMPINLCTAEEKMKFFQDRCTLVIADEDISNFRKSDDDIMENNKYAYTMFTSGSSGVPKGVRISEEAIYNRMLWMHKKYNLSRRILQKTTNVFDVSMWELSSPALGASLYMLKDGDEKYPDKISEAILKYKIQIIHFVPSMLRLFLDYCINNDIKIECMEDVFASGEKLTLMSIEGFKSVFTNAKLHNLYGPTECAVDVTYYDVTFDEKEIPIGLPVDNCSIEIVNHEKLLPPMEEGEICILGIQTGEYTDKNLKGFAERNGQRAYCTGDLGYINTDGNIYYKGRKDRQIKLRGMRVEPESIERAFKSINGINDVRVFVNNNMLCAVYTGKCDNVKAELSRKLSSREMPSIIKNTDAIPINQNGKTDYKELARFVLENESSEADIVLNDDERKLSEIISQETEIKNILPNEDLFNRGLDSLGVIKVVNAFSNASVKFSDFYELRTVRKIINNINSRKKLTVLKNNNSKKALVCVPFGGAEPQIFLDMCEYIDDSDVIGVYTSFFDENSSAENIGNSISECLCEMGYSSFNVMGICVGSVTALEIAHCLENQGKSVNNVIVGASLPTKMPCVFGRIISYWDFMNMNTIKLVLEKLGKGKILFDKQSEINFRKDTKRFFRYINNENRIYLNANIVMIFGKNDGITCGYKIKKGKWKKYIGDFKTITIKDTGHYFVKSEAEKLADIIKNL